MTVLDTASSTSASAAPALPGVLHSRRPWLSLYGVHVKTKAQEPAEAADLADIQRRIPDELMLIIFGKLDAYCLGSGVSLVCRHWRILSDHPRLWGHACEDAFRLSIPDHGEMCRLMMSTYRYSWKRMFVHHPHLRFDGVYVGRNTYVRTGVAEFSNSKAVHLVSYFRYFRFLANGTFLYRTSPNPVAKVAKSLRGLAAAAQAADRDRDSPVYLGRYALKGSKVSCLVVYPNSRSTEIRVRLNLRSTHPGANNRLDIESIVSFDREANRGTSLGPPQALDPDDEPDAAAGSAKAHSRGMAPGVFVPWAHVNSSPLNLPQHQMDFYVPG